MEPVGRQARRRAAEAVRRMSVDDVRRRRPLPLSPSGGLGRGGADQRPDRLTGPFALIVGDPL